MDYKSEINLTDQNRGESKWPTPGITESAKNEEKIGYSDNKYENKCSNTNYESG